MCTIIALHGVRDDFPLVLATNRDEFYARPTCGPQRLLEEPATVGGRDLQAGGTWLGVTEAGFFVGVTNQRSFAARRPDALSRGELVLSLLRLGRTAPARDHVAGVEGGRYSDFNLMFGDADEVALAYGRGTEPAVRIARLPPGLHVLPNDELDSPEFPKVARVQALLGAQTEAPWPALRDALARTLADRHTTPRPVPERAPAFFDADMMRALSALCVRTEVYGTRSSTIVALSRGRCAHYLFADGPPDQTPFSDVSPLFDAPAT